MKLKLYLFLLKVFIPIYSVTTSVVDRLQFTKRPFFTLILLILSEEGTAPYNV